MNSKLKMTLKLLKMITLITENLKVYYSSVLSKMNKI